MKKYITTIVLAMFYLTAAAQPNPRFVELENYFKELKSQHITYRQRNKGEGIEQEISTSFWINQTHSDDPELQLIMDSLEAVRNRPFVLAMDSIRRCFSELARTATESYQYEYHKGKRDTVEYAIAFAKEKEDSSQTFKYNNAVSFRYMREVGRFHFHNSESGSSKNRFGNGHYWHTYFADNPLGLTWEQLRPFNGEEFLRQIQPLLDNALKQKDVMKYPIHWQHDEGYEATEDKLMYKEAWFDDNQEENKHTGLATGMHYVFPKEQEDLAMDVLHQVDSIARAYVNAHPEQLYSYTHYERYYTGSWGTLLSGTVHRHTKEHSYELKCFLEEDGSRHLVFFTTIGDLWVPKDWKELKSWINGKREFLKK